MCQGQGYVRITFEPDRDYNWKLLYSHSDSCASGLLRTVMRKRRLWGVDSRKPGVHRCSSQHGSSMESTQLRSSFWRAHRRRHQERASFKHITGLRGIKPLKKNINKVRVSHLSFPNGRAESKKVRLPHSPSWRQETCLLAAEASAWRKV